jgi:hypothetical protein
VGRDSPGSGNWTHQKVSTTSANGVVMIRNVVDPSMTANLPESSSSNGIAVVVCPGGAFRALPWVAYMQKAYMFKQMGDSGKICAWYPEARYIIALPREERRR